MGKGEQQNQQIGDVLLEVPCANRMRDCIPAGEESTSSWLIPTFNEKWRKSLWVGFRGNGSLHRLAHFSHRTEVWAEARHTSQHKSCKNKGQELR